MALYDEDIEQCVAILKAGGIILYPTDTIWAIGCNANNEEAIQKIYALKGKVDKQKMMVLVGSERALSYLVHKPNLQMFDYIKGVSKPITVIYEGVEGLPQSILGKNRSVGIRICEDAFCKCLIKTTGFALVSTAASKMNEPTPLHFNDISDSIVKGVDYVVKHRQKEDSLHTPSSIIKWEKDGSITILRP